MLGNKSLLSLNKAFTLAEVLITLGIIGVVAAMTIPSLVQSYQEKEYITAFKEDFSILSQAYTQAVQENGTVDTWSAQDAYNNLKPYLKIQKDCQYPASVPLGCYRMYMVTGLSSNTDSAYSSPNIILANGAALEFYLDAGYMNVNIDINGKKPPNRWGYDYFSLGLSAKNDAPIVSWAYYGASLFTTFGASSCNPSTYGGWVDGVTCSYWIIKHWNMDYLHRVIPQSEWNQ